MTTTKFRSKSLTVCERRREPVLDYHGIARDATG